MNIMGYTLRLLLLILCLTPQLQAQEGGGAQVQSESEERRNTAARPNVLWITIEDTSPQFIGAYGNPDVHTPNVDRLVREGVRFNRAFAPAPVCAVARNALITGVSPNKTGTGHHRSAYPIPDFIRGYPAYVRDQGYYTTNNSKTDYNNGRAKEIIAESWDESSNQAGWWKRAPGQPFFSVFNIFASHQSRTMTKPRVWYEKNILDSLPDSLVTSAETLHMPPVFRDSPEMREHMARVLNAINYADLQVGELLDRLEADGLRDSTIIFFYADHGEAVPGGKATATGLGYQVPFAIWFPEAYRDLSPWAPGSATEELVVFQDLGPTLISLIGGEIPDYMEGRAMLGSARAPADDYIFTGRNRIDETPDLARSVTDGRYLYTYNFLPQYPILKPQKYAFVGDIVQTILADDRAGRLSEGQGRILRPQPTETLFDLQQDPWERNNLIDDAAQADRLARMRELLTERVLAERDLHFLPEVALAELAMPYEYRQDRQAYPLESALRTARLDPRSSEERGQLIDSLGAASPLIRYWAATALGRTPLDRTTESALNDALEDAHPTVAMLAAGALVRYAEDHGRAAEVLRNYALDKNQHRALTALQQMQYAGDASREFLSVYREKLRQLETDPGENGNMDYNLRSSAETSIFLLGEGPPLSY